MKYDQTLIDKWYNKTADSYAEIDDSPFIKRSMDEMVSVDFDGREVRKFFEGARVLDLCCGTGRLFPYLKKSRFVLGVDSSPKMLFHAKRSLKQLGLRGRLVKEDITRLKLGGETKFDIVISLGTLGEYVPLTSELTEKIYGCLSPGGLFVFTVVPIKSRLFMIIVKRLLQTAYKIIRFLPVPKDVKKRVYKSAFIAHVAHSANYVNRTLQKAGFKRVKHFKVLKKHFEHHEFVARKGGS